jgi:hypothetical protein
VGEAVRKRHFSDFEISQAVPAGLPGAVLSGSKKKIKI